MVVNVAFAILLSGISREGPGFRLAQLPPSSLSLSLYPPTNAVTLTGYFGGRESACLSYRSVAKAEIRLGNGWNAVWRGME